MRSLFLNSLIAASLLVSATPVLAAGASQPTTKLKYNAKMQKYCAIDPAVTGSHLQQQTCKTSAQWSAAGLDMPEQDRAMAVGVHRIVTGGSGAVLVGVGRAGDTEVGDLDQVGQGGRGGFLAIHVHIGNAGVGIGSRGAGAAASQAQQAHEGQVF